MMTRFRSCIPGILAVILLLAAPLLGAPAASLGLDAPGAAVAAPSRIWALIGGYEVRDDDLWTIATAVSCSVACGLVGCFLVLRRMSLLGDAISHAILPGLAGAFILTGSRDLPAMLAGAMVVGVLTASLVSVLNRRGRVDADSAMGVVFTSMFAVGVLLISWVARDVDLDPGCVLYGLIEFTPFDTVSLLGMQVPRSFVWLSLILLVDLAAILLFFKELRIVCFDPYLATTMGISATAVHYGLMTAVAGTAVASFEAVGSILVVAMLVAPGATAHLLTDRLSRLLWLAALIAAVAAVTGYALAVWLNTSVAGMIASVSLGLFLLAALASPSHGLVFRHARRLALAERIRREDMLGLLFRWQEHAARSPPASRPAVITTRQILTLPGFGRLGWLTIARLRVAGLVLPGTGPDRGLMLTERGLEEARRVVRGHRLWESYLVERLGRDAATVHPSAHATEHYLSDQLREALDRDLGDRTDPHGRAIP